MNDISRRSGTAVHRISNGYSSAYLVTSGGRAMLVDAATPSIAPRVLGAVRRYDVELRLILLTHFHYDHVGAAALLRDATGARVAIHHLDAPALRRGGVLQVEPARPLGRLIAPLIQHGVRAPLSPDLEFDDDEELGDYGGVGRSIWTPGHTAGSLSVLLPGGTVLAGDALAEAFPPLHGAGGPLFAEDREASVRSIATVARLASGRVGVAHRGWLDPRSVARMG